MLKRFAKTGYFVMGTSKQRRQLAKVLLLKLLSPTIFPRGCRFLPVLGKILPMLAEAVFGILDRCNPRTWHAHDRSGSWARESMVGDEEGGGAGGAVSE